MIDPDVLTTLSDRAFSDGMAEVIKYGAFEMAAFLLLLEELGEPAGHYGTTRRCADLLL